MLFAPTLEERDLWVSGFGRLAGVVVVDGACEKSREKESYAVMEFGG